MFSANFTAQNTGLLLRQAVASNKNDAVRNILREEHNHTVSLIEEKGLGSGKTAMHRGLELLKHYHETQPVMTNYVVSTNFATAFLGFLARQSSGSLGQNDTVLTELFSCCQTLRDMLAYNPNLAIPDSSGITAQQLLDHMSDNMKAYICLPHFEFHRYRADEAPSEFPASSFPVASR